MSQFAARTVTRLTLDDGAWIEARNRLTFGEEQQLASAMMSGMRNFDTTAEIGIDMERGAVERIAIWVTAWNFVDDEDRPVPFTRDAIKALDPDWADRIEKALDAHVEAMEAAKKAPTGTLRPVARSA